MSTSKARFQPGAGSTTHVKTNTKTSGTGTATSKRAGAGTAATHASGFPTQQKSSHVQVVYQGKILTPQSLLPRKGTNTAVSEGFHKKYATGKPFRKQQTIDEGASENADVKAASSPFPSGARLKRADSTTNAGGHSFAQTKLASGLVGKGKRKVEEMSTVILTETPTQMIMSMPSLVIASDTRDVIPIDERNAHYEQVVAAHSNVDGFSSRPTQTLNNPQKNQNEMAAPNALRDMGSQASAYDIKDAVAGANNTAADGDAAAAAAGIGVGSGTNADGGEDIEGLTPSVRKFITDTVSVAMVTPGCLLDTKNVTKPPSHAELAAMNAKHHKSGDRGKSKSTAGKSGVFSSVVTAGQASGASGDDVVNVGGQTTADFHGQHGHVGNAQSSSHAVDGNSNSGNNVIESAALSADLALLGSTSATGATGNHSGSKINMTSGDTDNEGSGQPHFSAEDSEEIMLAAEIERIMESPMLLKRLQMIERAIQQNANHRQQLDYRDLPDIAPLTLLSDRAKSRETGDALFGGNALGGKGGLNFTAALGVKGGDLGAKGIGDTLGGGNQDAELTAAEKAQQMADLLNEKDKKVKRLFSYSNQELIQGRPVTAMVWNAVSSDLLAVGYGKTEIFEDVYKPGEALDEEAQGGLVLFWSLRNPDYPEKILRTPHPVTALDFSKQNPMVLAAGLLNGDVNVYDVRREGANWGVPLESSKGMIGGHSDPVWQLKWIVKGVERLETLISISTDGRVLEWNLKKGLLVSTLMQLKKSGMGEGWISNTAAGLSFDFHPSDPTTYITGTEDGSIHRCSVSYNEQYLESYQSHEGPVYRISFSQRWPSLFLSCSADWSMNLYHVKFKNPMLSLRGTGENFPVNDISWCPDNSTVFACVTVDAKLQIWDLSVSSIDPIVTVDTNAEDAAGRANSNDEGNEEDDGGDPSSPHALAATAPLLTSRFPDRHEHKEDDNTSPVSKLLKNLTAEDKKKPCLTRVLFGEKNPSVVVGDNNGTVTVYRIFDPVTITHVGPLQQYEKLKSAVMQQTDPTNVSLLEAAESNDEEKM